MRFLSPFPGPPGPDGLSGFPGLTGDPGGAGLEFKGAPGELGLDGLPGNCYNVNYSRYIIYHGQSLTEDVAE